jgi:hypothetical protein
VSYGGSYGSAPRNPSTPLDVVNSAVFGPAVLRAVQDTRLRGYLVDKSVPWDAVDLPLVADLPQQPKDRAEVNLLIGTGVTRMLYRAATNLWYQIGAAPSVTTLPSAPPDGLTVSYVADDTNGVEWLLRYDSTEATYRWHYAGGPPLYNEVTAAGTRTANSYAAADTGGAGPTLTVPLAGDYDVTIAAGMYQTTGGIGYYSYKIGASAAVDADSMSEGQLTGVYMARTRRKTALAAATVLLAQYKASANTLNIGDRAMSALPVRVI